MNLRNTKIKILTANAKQWYNAVDKAVSMGAYSNDGEVDFIPGKEAMVIDHGAIQASRPSYRPKKAPYDAVMSYNDFMNGTEPCMPVTECLNLGSAVATAIMDMVKVDGIAPADYLTPTVVSVPHAQHDVIFKTKGIKYLQDRGVNFEQDGDNFYHLNLKENTAELVTAQWVCEQGTSDIMDGEDTPFASYLLDFELIEEITFGRKDADAEDAE